MRTWIRHAFWLSLWMAAPAFGAEVTSVQTTPPNQSTAPSDASDDGWSLDDIKDVFEGLQFAAITVAIGVGVYWFFSFYMPRARSKRIAFDVSVTCLGTTPSCRLIEVAAALKNSGRAGIELAELRYSLAGIASGSEIKACGELRIGGPLAPLC